MLHLLTLKLLHWFQIICNVELAPSCGAHSLKIGVLKSWMIDWKLPPIHIFALHVIHQPLFGLWSHFQRTKLCCHIWDTSPGQSQWVWAPCRWWWRPPSRWWSCPRTPCPSGAGNSSPGSCGLHPKISNSKFDVNYLQI